MRKLYPHIKAANAWGVNDFKHQGELVRLLGDLRRIGTR